MYNFGVFRCIALRNFLFLISALFILASCGGGKQGSVTPAPSEPEPMQPPVVTLLPIINNVGFNTQAATLYNKVEIQVDLAATYQNPYDHREIVLAATFTSPNNELYRVSGFWNGINQWLVRFTPSAVGNWQYSLQVTDSEGESNLFTGNFFVNPSNKSGWLQVGNQVNENYSSRYLAYHDGTPFYGVGHADAFVNLFGRRASVDLLIQNMREAKENYFVWWPQFDFSIVENNFNDYNIDNVRVIDQVIEKIEQEELFLIFTIWDHSQLRDDSHPWAEGNWLNNNGFNQLVSADNFFIDQEAWAWQENLYRYVIARWGYSPAIAMWQTVSEIDGTNAFGQTNSWHERVNKFFQQNDPYQHPTTASMAGDLTWDEGHALMTVPQVHIYQDLLAANDNTRALTIDSAAVVAGYTQAMWQLENKPNWIGEFGIWNSAFDENKNYYPELFHHVIWAGLSSGAALTPAEWNDFFDWQIMTTEMKAHMSYFSDFVNTLPLVQWKPKPINISTGENLRAWGLLGEKGGIVWLQDTSLAGLDIEQIRLQKTLVTNANLFLPNEVTGSFQITPFNTWNGEFLASFNIQCDQISVNGCEINIPPFIDDIAIRINRLTP